MRIISYPCEDDLENGLRDVKMFGNQLDSDKAGLYHDEMDLFDVGNLQENGLAGCRQTCKEESNVGLIRIQKVPDHFDRNPCTFYNLPQLLFHLNY